MSLPHPRTVSLFGCKSGEIPKLLSHKLPAGQSEPYTWHLEVPRVLAETGALNGTLIIDLKPAQHEKKLSLYELLDVWGYSAHNWTPMRMRGLFLDVPQGNIDPRDFVCDLGKAHDPIFSLMYLAGTISNGSLVGRWTAPPPTSTNGVLLWPPVMQYFSAQAAQVMDAKNG
jgi:hypothetical protein